LGYDGTGTYPVGVGDSVKNPTALSGRIQFLPKTNTQLIYYQFSKKSDNWGLASKGIICIIISHLLFFNFLVTNFCVKNRNDFGTL
jgi:hypothetical protein